MDETRLKAALELRAMSEAYFARGKYDKARELMNLAHDIEKAIMKDENASAKVVDMEKWQTDHGEYEQEG